MVSKQYSPRVGSTFHILSKALSSLAPWAFVISNSSHTNYTFLLSTPSTALPFSTHLRPALSLPIAKSLHFHLIPLSPLAPSTWGPHKYLQSCCGITLLQAALSPRGTQRDEESLVLSPLHARMTCCLVQHANVLDTSRQITLSSAGIRKPGALRVKQK